MTRPARVASGALVLAAFVGAPAAHADDGDAAERYFRAGEQAYLLQSFGAAAQDFEEAYKAAPLPEIAFSAAQAYRRQYRIDPQPEYVVRAVAMYRAYLAKVKTGGRVRDAADGLGDMEHELERLIHAGVKVAPELAAEHTQLGVDVSLGGPAARAGIHEVDDRGAATLGVQVTLDGEPVQPFALLHVTPGRHVLRAQAPGYRPAERNAVAVQGSSTMLEMELAPLPAQIAVTAERGTRIAVDGRDVGTMPLGAISAPAGPHVISLSRHGRTPIVRSLVVSNDQHVRLDVPMEMTGKRRALPWVAGTATVFAVGAGVTGTLALIAHHDAIEIARSARTTGNLDPDTGRTYARDRDRVNTLAPATWVLGGLALATAGAAIALYELDDQRPRLPKLEPVITTTGATIGISGRF